MDIYKEFYNNKLLRKNRGVVVTIRIYKFILLQQPLPANYDSITDVSLQFTVKMPGCLPVKKILLLSGWEVPI